jgi:hypothetical protein
MQMKATNMLKIWKKRIFQKNDVLVPSALCIEWFCNVKKLLYM